MAAVESEAKDAYNNYQQDDQGGKLNTTEFAEQEYKDFTQPQGSIGPGLQIEMHVDSRLQLD
ncbi:MAG: hypothetical protein FRX49_01698 [Trebouxia sp. A1-2]|nr:MAG: hypothetical protein FRX49_01698 [Trebouxia sp. A1-2]